MPETTTCTTCGSPSFAGRRCATCVVQTEVPLLKLSAEVLAACRDGLGMWSQKNNAVITRAMLNEMVGEIVLAYVKPPPAWLPLAKEIGTALSGRKDDNGH